MIYTFTRKYYIISCFAPIQMSVDFGAKHLSVRHVEQLYTHSKLRVCGDTV